MKGKKDEMLSLLQNTLSTFRESLARRLDASGRDYDASCGYPYTLGISDYKALYERDGIAKRVVRCLPEESWSIYPTVYEDEDPEIETDFEKKWKDICKDNNVFSVLARADVLSGIGQFGIILLGIGDGMDLSVEAKKSKTSKLLYLRVFDERVTTISGMETNVQNKRYGKPLYYKVGTTNLEETKVDKTIHYSRVVHIADNRDMSDIYGVPRMQCVFNRIVDIRKILSGSGEMFWQGGFPGYVFETPDDIQVEIDGDEVREEMYKLTQGLQRYIALQNLRVKTLAPQVVDPKGHIDVQIESICITLGIPKRIFIGSERGELASSQDTRTWNNRLMHRQETYITPYIIQPFIDKCIDLGILPEPKEYNVEWPDLNAATDSEKADISEKRTRSLAQYVTGSVESLIPPLQFLTLIMGFSQDEAEDVIEAQLEAEREMEVDEKDTEIVTEVE